MDGSVNLGGGEPAGSVVSIPDPSVMTTEDLINSVQADIRKISMSEMVEYRDCRRKWYLHHKLGLSKKNKTGALALGTNVHTALQTYYTPGGTKESAFADFNAVYEELKNNANEYEIDDVLKDEKLGRTMIEGYFDWAEETGIDAHLDIIEAEAEIEYAMEVLGQKVLLVGKRDLIGKNTLTGVNKLIDHKTCQSFIDNMMDLNEQARMYLLLQRLVGSTEVQEVLWNKLRKVLRTARANPPFYQREELYISEEELRRFFIRIRGIIRDILMTEAQLADGQDPNEFCYPRPSSDCTWKCPFRKVCPLMDSDPVGANQMIADLFENEDPYLRYKEVKGIS